jgi:hypothetical protein
LDPVNVLLTVCEIAIAVVGFAAIALAIRPTAFQSEASLSALQLRVMIETAIGTIAISLFPTPLFALQFESATVWRVASALLAAATLSYAASNFIRQKRIFGTLFPAETRTFDITISLTGLLVVGLLGFNCSTASAGPAAYLVGTFWWLSGAILLFIRLLFFHDNSG